MNANYPQTMFEIIDRLFPFNPYMPNKVYQQNDGLYVFKNTKGFIHVLKPCKVKYDGELDHYEICDYLLTDKNTIKEVKSWGNFKTREDCIKKIKSL